MLNTDLIRQNPEKVKKACKDKGVDEKIVDRLLRVDDQRRQLILDIEKTRKKRNLLLKDIKEKPDQKTIDQGKKLKGLLLRLEPDLRAVEEQFKNLLYQIPNIPADDVSVGKDESENRLVKKWGEIPKFAFKAKDHLELGERLNLIDVKRAAKVSGARFGYLKNEAVLLEFALIQYGLEVLIKEGFTPVIPPILIKNEMMREMGYLEHGGDQETYHLEKDGLYLIGTSEQSIGPLHAQEVLKEKELPKRYLGFSSCFRREAGSYGKDTRGIFRVHQFDKLEMFSFVVPSDSDKEHKFLLSLEGKLVQALEIPYRVVEMCTGDLGHPAARKYDIECWFPSQEKYRETHSTSTCTDFQARRLNIKYRKKDGQIDFVHTVNGTFFAQRLIIAILENYQQKDGSVKIPKVLQKYVGKEKISPKNKAH